MAQRDEHDANVSLRLQTSPAIVAQMSDSLVKAAPWTMRPSLWVDRTMRRLQSLDRQRSQASPLDAVLCLRVFPLLSVAFARVPRAKSSLRSASINS